MSCDDFFPLAISIVLLGWSIENAAGRIARALRPPERDDGDDGNESDTTAR